MNNIKKYFIKDTIFISDSLEKLMNKSNILNNNKINNNILIKKIYKIFKKNINKKINNYDIGIYKFDYNKYKNLLNYNFIDDTIKINLKKNINTLFKIKYKNININLFHKNKILSIKIKKIINKILNILICLQKLFKNNKTLNINLLFSSHKKKFPKKNETIGPLHSNSGLTYFPDTNKNGVIIIFREEEYSKVLIHECIHAMYGDSNLWDSKNNNNIFNKYCLNLFEYNKININETYTEFLASILHQIFIIVYCKLPLNKINLLFKYESFYSLIKVKQILNHYNYKNIKDIYKKNKCKVFNQKTSVLSYYIFKTALYFNVIETLNFYNKTNNFKIQNTLTETFLKLINISTDKLLLTIISNINLHNYKSKTLRMTLFSIK